MRVAAHVLINVLGMRMVQLSRKTPLPSRPGVSERTYGGWRKISTGPASREGYSHQPFLRNRRAAMPDPSQYGSRQKFDHSDHSTSHAAAGDLRAPGGGAVESGGDGGKSRGGISQDEPVISPDSKDFVAVGKKGSRLRRLDSRSPADK
jgi:hypothetical protein